MYKILITAVASTLTAVNRSCRLLIIKVELSGARRAGPFRRRKTPILVVGGQLGPWKLPTKISASKVVRRQTLRLDVRTE